MLLSPVFLALLVVCALPFFWPRAPKGPQSVRRAAMRSFVLLCFVVALADPVVVGKPNEDLQVLVYDSSDRQSPADREAAWMRIREFRAALGDDSRFLFVSDEQNAWLPADLGDRDRGARPGDELCFVDPSTFVELLELARARIPDGVPAAITCLTDGLSEGASADVARVFSEPVDVPIRFVEMAPRRADPRVVDLSVGRIVRGATARAVAVLDGTVPAESDSGLDVVLSIREGTGDEGPSERELARLPDFRWEGRTELEFEFELARAGFGHLAVQLESGSSAAADAPDSAAIRRIERAVAVQDPLRVLVLEGLTEGAGRQLQRLCGPGFEFDVRTPAGDGGLTDFEAALANCDVVVVDDLPAESFPESAQSALRDAVTDRGLGVLMAGGDGVFGPGGYYDTPVGDMLPVGFVQREEHRDPSTTLAVIIDTSGSMGGMRVSLAKEVARLAMQRLLPHDKVGIVEFYGAKRWAAPIQSAANRIELQRALNRLDAGGGTVILPAIEEAFYALQNVQTRYRHVLILTDGGVERGAFEPLVRAMADEGITVSTVLIGPQAHSEFLVQIANWGRGRFYSVPNRFNLPELLLKQPSTSKLPAYRPGTHMVRVPSGATGLSGLDLAAMPPLRGYVETESRDGAEVLVETVQESHPIAATWRFGLGRVSAFTSEMAGRGTDTFGAWDGYGPFVARFLERTASDLRAPFEVSHRRERDRVVVIAERRSTWSTTPGGTLALVGADGSATPEQPLVFVQTAPGRFEAVLPIGTDESRDLRFSLSTAIPVWTERAVSDRLDARRPERQVDPAGALDFEALSFPASDLSAGRGSVPLTEFAPAPLEPGARGTEIAFRFLWPWFCALGLLAYLLDVFLRRRPLNFGAAKAAAPTPTPSN